MRNLPLPINFQKFIALMVFSLFGCLSCSVSGSEEDQYYTIEDFSKVKKIDAHVHINTDNNALLEQALVDKFELLTINVEVPDYPSLEQQLKYAKEQKEVSPGTVHFLSTFETETILVPGWQNRAIEQIKTSINQGSIGIKVWKNIGMVLHDLEGNFIQIDDARFDPIFGFLEENEIPICGHIGEPKNCWLPLEEMTVNNDRNYYRRNPQYHMFQHPEHPSHEDLIGARDRVMDKFPDLKFIGTHLGSMEWSVDEIAMRLDKYPNMAVDLTARISHLQYQSLKDWERVHQFFHKYQDRIMYGTDLHITEDADPVQVKKNAHKTWMMDWQYFVSSDSMQNDKVNGKFKGLKLPKEIIDKIYYKNFRNWYNMGE